jgi:hypothetical protein
MGATTPDLLVEMGNSLTFFWAWPGTVILPVSTFPTSWVGSIFFTNTLTYSY